MKELIIAKFDPYLFTIFFFKFVEKYMKFLITCLTGQFRPAVFDEGSSKNDVTTNGLCDGGTKVLRINSTTMGTGMDWQK